MACVRSQYSGRRVTVRVRRATISSLSRCTISIRSARPPVRKVREKRRSPTLTCPAETLSSPSLYPNGFAVLSRDETLFPDPNARSDYFCQHSSIGYFLVSWSWLDFSLVFPLL